MEYITIKQKMATLLFVLAFGCAVTHAKIRIDDPRTAIVADEIKAGLECDDKLAEDVRQLLHHIDNSIFLFVDYQGNRFNCQWHAGQFNCHLESLRKCIIKAQHEGNMHAVQTLQDMLKNLTELVGHVKKAHGSKGMLAAISLGKNIDPVIKKFGSYFPTLELGTEYRIQEKYRKEATLQVYLEHLGKRLEVK